LNIAKERLSNPILQRERTRLEPLSNSLLEGERTRLSNLFAIQDPNNNLPFTNTEVETIAANFHPQQILKNNEASKANLQEKLPHLITLLIPNGYIFLVTVVLI